jgi:F0F1-type ATP synthase assembly protein I
MSLKTFYTGKAIGFVIVLVLVAVWFALFR